MGKIYEQEELLLEKWYEETGRDKSFCYDGLCFNGKCKWDEKNGECWIASSGDEEKLWEQSERRVLFLLKEPNGNIKDAREFPWSLEPTSKDEGYEPKWKWSQGLNLMWWLEGISKMTPEFYPQNSAEDYLENPHEIFTREDIRQAIAYVNIKKTFGGAKANYNEIYSWGEKYSSLLKQQVAEILNPNIVVCCGAGVVVDIAMKFIYPNVKFSKFGDWFYYASKYENKNLQHDLLLIDSYHPSAWQKYISKVYDYMMMDLSDLLNTESPDFL